MGGDGHAGQRHSRASAASRDQAAARLVIRVQAGERGAFEDLYEQFFDPLYGYMLSFVRRDDVEDVVQRVFERLIRVLPRYTITSGSSVRGWLFRLARNEALDYRRERDQAQALPPEEMTREIEVQGRRLGQTPVVDVGWVSDTALATALRALTTTQREVVVLYYVADLPLTEIAGVLGTSATAVRQHHRRALTALGERLSPARRAPGPKRPPLAMCALGRGVPHLMTGGFSVAH